MRLAPLQRHPPIIDAKIQQYSPHQKQHHRVRQSNSTEIPFDANATCHTPNSRGIQSRSETKNREHLACTRLPPRSTSSSPSSSNPPVASAAVATRARRPPRSSPAVVVSTMRKRHRKWPPTDRNACGIPSTGRIASTSIGTVYCDPIGSDRASSFHRGVPWRHPPWCCCCSSTGFDEAHPNKEWNRSSGRRVPLQTQGRHLSLQSEADRTWCVAVRMSYPIISTSKPVCIRLVVMSVGQDRRYHLPP
mmetsp:Transcript_18633/g.39022  ORF Transcript_18633/g.39022 Transcript_18633/m.39022 type:complete len:248 (+) Transcript_18633:606-1349(+)